MGSSINAIAGLLMFAGVAILAFYLMKAVKGGAIDKLARGIGGSLAVGGSGSGYPIAGGQFGPQSSPLAGAPKVTAAAVAPAAAAGRSPFTAAGAFAEIGGGGPVPLSRGGSMTVPWAAGPTDFTTATSPVRITSPLTTYNPGGAIGTHPAGAVISVIDGVPISLSDFAVAKLGFR